jgi:hypothetical protein
MDNRIEITSTLSMDEAVERLSRGVKSSALSTCSRAALSGRVTREKVYLYKVTPFVGNTFLPVFDGAFEEKDGKTTLCGKWSAHPHVKVFFGLYAGSMVYTIVPGIGDNENVALPLIIVNLLLLFVGWFSWRISSQMASNDKAWIVRYVTFAINPPSEERLAQP